MDLTTREKEIVRLISLGCSVVEAAQILQVARGTADNHKTRAMGKLGVTKAALVTRAALKLGITDLDDCLTRGEKSRRDKKPAAKPKRRLTARRAKTKRPRRA